LALVVGKTGGGGGNKECMRESATALSCESRRHRELSTEPKDNMRLKWQSSSCPSGARALCESGGVFLAGETVTAMLLRATGPGVNVTRTTSSDATSSPSALNFFEAVLDLSVPP